MNTTHQPLPSAHGYCSRCKTDHSLSSDSAQKICLELMQILEEKKRIDLMVSDDQANPRFSTEYLFGEARGKMFGVLVCLNKKGSYTILRSFSGQYNGIWKAAGWAPPLFSTQTLFSISRDVEKKIKEMGREIKNHIHQSKEQRQLIKTRKSLSRNLMKNIHGLYTLSNFRGETKSFEEVYIGTGIPTGTGDCCAPKLLNYAARNNLKPLSLAEFYWGKENLSGTRKHGKFYSSCPDKCQPILGYMLCGL
ncbi:MAG: hypothetical protein KAQ71_00790 [Desulfobulbaceae bacterium]|nr:hypothetical protein [Desulfobulbaceae bacterium]